VATRPNWFFSNQFLMRFWDELLRQIFFGQVRGGVFENVLRGHDNLLRGKGGALPHCHKTATKKSSRRVSLADSIFSANRNLLPASRKRVDSDTCPWWRGKRSLHSLRPWCPLRAWRALTQKKSSRIIIPLSPKGGIA